MKLGLVSAIADTMNYEEMIDLVAESGLECVEVACWPVGKAERRYAGVSHIDAGRVLEDDGYASHLLDYAAEKKVFITEAIWTRYQPMREIISQVVNSGIIGEPRMLTANLGYEIMGKERIVEPALAGGALLDVGIYPLNFAEMVFGAPDQVHAVGVLSDKGVDLQDSMTLTWKDGKMAVLNAGANCVSDRLGVIYGTRGFAVVENINNPQSITVYDAQYQQAGQHPCPAQLTGYEYEVVEAARCIEAGALECPSMPHQDTVHMMELMDEIRHQMGVRYPFE